MQSLFSYTGPTTARGWARIFDGLNRNGQRVSEAKSGRAVPGGRDMPSVLPVEPRNSISQHKCESS